MASALGNRVNGNLVQFDKANDRGKVDEVVYSSVKETLSGLLDDEVDLLIFDNTGRMLRDLVSK